MPDTKITGLATGTTIHSADWLVYVDTTDTTMASSGTDKKLSPSVLVAGLPVFGPSGVSHAPGVVPDPGSSPSSTRFLREDATWVAPSGGGGGLTPIANNLVLANISGASAVPVGDSLTAIIDSAISNVQGTMLYRDSASWQALAPGTNGQLLASQGTAANPHWITGAGGTGTVTSITVGSGLTGSPNPITAAGAISIASSAITYGMIQNEIAASLLGNPTGSAAAPSEVTLGSNLTFNGSILQMANRTASSLMGNPTGSLAAPADITLGPNMSFMGSTLRGRSPICSVLSPSTAIANTAALTSIFTGATLGGSLTIPANTLQAGSLLRFELLGTFGATGTPNLICQISLGGTIIIQGTSQTFAAAPTGFAWLFDHILGFGIQCQVTGASGKVIGGDRINLATGAQILMNTSGTNNLASTQVTVNTTTALVIDVKFQWSAAAPANTIQLLGGAIYLDG